MSEADALAYWLGNDRETFVAEDDDCNLGTYYFPKTNCRFWPPLLLSSPTYQSEQQSARCLPPSALSLHLRLTAYGHCPSAPPFQSAPPNKRRSDHRAHPLHNMSPLLSLRQNPLTTLRN